MVTVAYITTMVPAHIMDQSMLSIRVIIMDPQQWLINKLQISVANSILDVRYSILDTYLPEQNQEFAVLCFTESRS